MTVDEFNKKWERYLEDGFYGLTINDPKVIAYLDEQFEEEVKFNENFRYSQIKLKFGTARVYANSERTHEWEGYIDGVIADD